MHIETNGAPRSHTPGIPAPPAPAPEAVAAALGRGGRPGHGGRGRGHPGVRVHPQRGGHHGRSELDGLSGLGSLKTPFTVTLPANAACSGDTACAGYHVYSYLVPKGTAVSSVTFTEFPSTGYGFVNNIGTYYGAANTAATTGQVISIPNNFQWAPLVSARRRCGLAARSTAAPPRRVGGRDRLRQLLGRPDRQLEHPDHLHGQLLGPHRVRVVGRARHGRRLSPGCHRSTRPRARLGGTNVTITGTGFTGATRWSVRQYRGHRRHGRAAPPRSRPSSPAGWRGRSTSRSPRPLAPRRLGRPTSSPTLPPPRR